jgi:four helix bundle protein
MHRAAVSVPSNIAEGYALESRNAYLRHLRVARGSLAELATQWELAVSLKLLAEDVTTLNLLTEADRVLQGLIRGVRNAKPRSPR